MTERRIAVAYSGGRDSTALLHATLHQAATCDVQVVALHVHHGLSERADTWLESCAAQCRRWARRGLPVEFAAHRVSGRPASGDSIEAWARQARYAALRQMAEAHAVRIVLLGHHRRDQAETLLLQALRGAGVAGLAGMPESIVRDGITWQRPWLHKARDEIEAYVRRHRLRHVDDESNADPRHARNRLRLQVWPALTEAFEAAESTLAASAEWAQQANALLDEIAVLDLAAVAGKGPLAVGAWGALSSARRSNVLRAWLLREGGVRANASLVKRLLGELTAVRTARWATGSGELRLYRGLLSHTRMATLEPIETDRETSLDARGEGRHSLPGWQGEIEVERVGEGGVPVAWLARIELRGRSGGEQFQSGPARPPRSLKKQYQDAGVPVWQRAGPLLFSGGQLLFVPGLGLDARAIGLPGQAMAMLRWLPRERAV